MVDGRFARAVLVEDCFDRRDCAGGVGVLRLGKPLRGGARIFLAQDDKLSLVVGRWSMVVLRGRTG